MAKGRAVELGLLLLKFVTTIFKEARLIASLSGLVVCLLLSKWTLDSLIAYHVVFNTPSRVEAVLFLFLFVEYF